MKNVISDSEATSKQKKEKKSLRKGHLVIVEAST